MTKSGASEYYNSMQSYKSSQKKKTINFFLSKNTNF